MSLTQSAESLSTIRMMKKIGRCASKGKYYQVSENTTIENSLKDHETKPPLETAFLALRVPKH